MLKFSMSVHIINTQTCIHTHSVIPGITTEMTEFLLENTVFPQHNAVDLPMTF